MKVGRMEQTRGVRVVNRFSSLVYQKHFFTSVSRYSVNIFVREQTQLLLIYGWVHWNSRKLVNAKYNEHLWNISFHINIVPVGLLFVTRIRQLQRSKLCNSICGWIQQTLQTELHRTRGHNQRQMSDKGSLERWQQRQQNVRQSMTSRRSTILNATSLAIPDAFQQLICHCGRYFPCHRNLV